jgi:hypothetical protein
MAVCLSEATVITFVTCEVAKRRYHEKVVESASACFVPPRDRRANILQAHQFLDHLDGRHETVDSEPGLYRHTEIVGDGFRAFELTSLLPKTGFDLHVAKMTE